MPCVSNIAPLVTILVCRVVLRTVVMRRGRTSSLASPARFQRIHYIGVYAMTHCSVGVWGGARARLRGRHVRRACAGNQRRGWRGRSSDGGESGRGKQRRAG